MLSQLDGNTPAALRHQKVKCFADKELENTLNLEIIDEDIRVNAGPGVRGYWYRDYYLDDQQFRQVMRIAAVGRKEISIVITFAKVEITTAEDSEDLWPRLLKPLTPETFDDVIGEWDHSRSTCQCQSTAI